MNGSRLKGQFGNALVLEIIWQPIRAARNPIRTSLADAPQFY